MSKNTRRDILRTTAGAGSVAIVSWFGPQAGVAEADSLAPQLAPHSVASRVLSYFTAPESLWWRCHRRIIADYLILAGAKVIHIIGQGRTITAQATSAAHMKFDGKVVYPDPAQKTVGASASADNLRRQIERWVNEGGAGGEDNSTPLSDKAEKRSRNGTRSFIAQRLM